MTMPSLPSNEGPKSFWSKKESIPALVFWAVAAGAAIWFWGLIVPFLLSAAEDTLHLMIVGGTIAAILILLTSKRVHYIGRSISRMITGWFVAIDPIGIRKTYIEETEKKKAELDNSLNSIRGLRIQLQRRLSTNQAAYDQSMRFLQGAQAAMDDPKSDDNRKRQAQRVIASESKHSDGLSVLITKQKAHLERYDVIINVLGRYGEVCDDTILDLKRQVELQEQDREESRGFNKGMRSAFGILRGFGQDKEMDDMATEQLERDYTQQMGEVEGLLDLTKDVISKADFDDEASLASVKSKLDAWGSTNSNMQIGRGGSSKKQLLNAAGGTVVDTTTPEKAEVSNHPGGRAGGTGTRPLYIGTQTLGVPLRFPGGRMTFEDAFQKAYA